MKKIFVAVFVLSLLVPVLAFGEDAKKDEMPGMGMGMPMPGMGKMCGPRMGNAQMVATDEGGVIVLVGNKLMKYDADLNVVKEVEVPMPVPPMGGKQCPMMGKMGGEGAAPAAESTQEKAS